MKITPYHLPYNPDLVPRAKALRQTMTRAERKLWHGYLKSLGIRFLRQRPIDNFIVDFYCPGRKLVIEIDGGGHHTESGRVYDAERTKVLEGYGLTVLRFTNREVLSGFDGVCARIEAHLARPPRQV